jgi:hypothetical protein
MLTPAAAAAMIDARGEVGVPDEWGIRFHAGPDGPPAITFDFVAGPEPDDVLGGSSKLRTYVEAAVHRQIGDATVDYDDADGSAELVIRPHHASALGNRLAGVSDS